MPTDPAPAVSRSGPAPSYRPGRPLVCLRGVSKRFGTIQALRQVDFDVFAGEIHVLLGENGAGKTSLVSVLAGLYLPDEGVLEVEGRPLTIRSPVDGLKAGVAMIPQHVEVISNLRVWENVVLGREGSRWWLHRRRLRNEVRALAERHGLDVDPDAEVGRLSAGQQQKVEILKMLFRQARVLILDEPTTYLTPQETDALFQTLEDLTRQGITVLLVTHKVRDALRVGHRLTVMRAGQVVATVQADEADEGQLIRWLMGAGPEKAGAEGAGPVFEPPPPPDPQAPLLLETVGLATDPSRGRVGLREVALQLRRGEIVGVAGVAGSGQEELAEVLGGLLPVKQGRVFLHGRDVTRWPARARLEAGLMVIPEDRVRDGILPTMALMETLVLGLHRRLASGLRYPVHRVAGLAARAVEEFEVKAPDVRVPTAYLSGGNMQRVLVARAVAHCRLCSQPVLLALNPTRGLDVRAFYRVHRHLRQVAARGGAVLLVSEDLDELMASCHRLEVMRGGRLAASFQGPGFDRYRIGEAMLGR